MVAELLRMGQELDDTRRKVLIGKAVDYICRVKPEITREMIMEVERVTIPQEVFTSPFLEGTLENKMQEGIEQGAEQKARKVARMMLQDNEPIDKICRYTGLSSDTVRELS